MTEYIVKIRILDEDETFREEIEKTGYAMMFFADGGAARVEEPDWNEIEDLIRESKKKHERGNNRPGNQDYEVRGKYEANLQGTTGKQHEN